MSSWARVGVKVVCVRSGQIGDGHKPVIAYPSMGEVYTVKDVFEDKFGRGSLQIQLAELPNPWKSDLSVDNGWRIDRFRPLITKSQEDDISMFKSLLKPTEVPA